MLWQDNIMGNAPLIESEDLKEIRAWLSQRGINKITDISAWDDSGRWKSWDLSGVPNQMQCKNPSSLLR
jgi:hypothetical protein